MTQHSTNQSELRSPIAAGIIAALVAALETGRDYVSDAQIGGLVYDDGKRVDPNMVAEDLARIDAALAAAEAKEPPAANATTADEMEAEGWAPWLQKQPIEDLVRRWRGQKWVPLDAAIPALQFWQRRDYEHSVAFEQMRGAIAKAEAV